MTGITACVLKLGIISGSWNVPSLEGGKRNTVKVEKKHIVEIVCFDFVQYYNNVF